MTVNDLVAGVLAFVRVNGPIDAVAYLTGVLVAILAVFYLSAKVAGRFYGRKTFDIGGTFDHFYSRILPAARSGVVALIFAGYVWLWLSRWPAASPNSRCCISPTTAAFTGCWRPSS